MRERIGKLKCNIREIILQNSTKDTRIVNEIKYGKVNENKIKFEVASKRHE